MHGFKRGNCRGTRGRRPPAVPRPQDQGSMPGARCRCRTRRLSEPHQEKIRYDFVDTGHLTPLVEMHTLGSSFITPGIHAGGGLRYHGMAPLISHVTALGLIEAWSVQQLDAFAAGIQFARAEGIIPAPEANHVVAGAISEALRSRKEGPQRTILFNLSGHGHCDMQS